MKRHLDRIAQLARQPVDATAPMSAEVIDKISHIGFLELWQEHLHREPTRDELLTFLAADDDPETPRKWGGA